MAPNIRRLLALDPVPETSSSDEILTTIELLRKGNETIVISEKYRSVTLAVGTTGSGKSTAVQWLAGDDSKLISVPVTGSSSEFIIKDGSRISDGTTESKTIFPELVEDKLANSAIYDCPGFQDTRSASNDIATTYFIKRVADNLVGVKLLLVVGYPSVREGVNRIDFVSLLKHATELMKNDVAKFNNSISMLVTKVDKQIVEVQEDQFRSLRDDEIIATIAGFLTEVQSELSKKTTSDSKAAAQLQLVTTLLKKDFADRFSRIAIFRRPDKPGPLSELKPLQQGKKAAREMVAALEFTPMKPDFFGYTISDTSKNIVSDLARKFNDNVWQQLNALIVGDIREHNKGMIEELTNKVGSIDSATATAADMQMKLASISLLMSNFHDSQIKFSELVSELKKKDVNVVTMWSKLNEILTTLNIQINSDRRAAIITETGYFDFLQKVTNIQLETRSWQSLFQQTVDHLSNGEKEINNRYIAGAQKMFALIDSTVVDISTLLLNNIQSINQELPIQSLSSKYDQSAAIVSQLTKEVSTFTTVEKLALAVDGTLARLGSEIEGNYEIKHRLRILYTGGIYLNYLKQLDSKTVIWHSEWLKPFSVLFDSLTFNGKWYRFLVDLQAKLGTWQFQQDTTQYNVADLANWGTGSAKDQGIQITDKNLRTFWSKLSELKLSEFDSVSNNNQTITGLHLQDLNQLLNLLLLKQKLNIDCTAAQDGKLTITQDFLKVSSLMDPNHTLANFCGDKKVTDLTLMATNTVFFDTDLDASDKQLNMTIIAPRWEMPATKQVKLSLGGITGSERTPAKAKDANKPEENGQDGQRGNVGGPGSNFLGMSNTFVTKGNKNESLIIEVKGGKGGPGQNGGNGGAGVSGKDAFKPTGGFLWNDCDYGGQEVRFGPQTHHETGVVSQSSQAFEVYGKPGSSGGAGGNGGASGLGGLPGEIRLFDLNDKDGKVGPELVITLINNGTEGIGGQGGQGGLGGKHGKNLEGRCINYGFNVGAESEFKEDGPLGPTGANGTAGANLKPDNVLEEPKKITDPGHRVESFKKYARDNLFGVNQRFKQSTIIEFLDQLDHSASVTNLADIATLATELIHLEKQFPTLQKYPIEALHFYKSIQSRIDAYAKKPKNSEKGNEFKKMLNYLAASVLGKVNLLKSNNGGSETNLIIDVATYLSITQKSLDELKVLRDAKNENEIVKKYKEEYVSDLNKQIEAAKEFINKQVTPEFDRVFEKIENKIDELIKDTIELEKKAVENRDKLFKKKAEMYDAMVLHAAFGVVKLIGQAASLFGGGAAAVGSAVSSTASVEESFQVDQQTAVKRPFTLPDSVTNQNSGSLNDAETQTKQFQGQQLKEMKDRLEEYKKMAKKLPEVVKKADEALAKLKYLEKTPENDHSQAIKDLDTQFKENFADQEKELKKKKDAGDNKAKDDLDAMGKVKKVMELGSAGFELYKKFMSDLSDAEAASEAFEQAKKDLEKVEQYRHQIYTEMAPGVRQLQSDLTEVRSGLGQKQRVALDVAKWQVQSQLKDMQQTMRKFLKDQEIKGDYLRSIEKLQEAMTITVKLYDRIQQYQEQQKFANFMANLHTKEINDAGSNDPKLASLAQSLSIALRSNVVLQQYQTSVEALKQMVFPYAHLYLEQMVKPLKSDNNGTQIEDFIPEVQSKIKAMRDKLELDRKSIGKEDQFKHSKVDFHKDPTKCTEPFYVWPQKDFADQISQLLSGKPVVLKADIRHSSPEKDAVKFNLVELNFRTANQSGIDAVLKPFAVTATHLGNSYYRYSGEHYVISNAPQPIWYQIGLDKKGKNHADANDVYNKIKNGDLMLSPYAMWQFQLAKVGSKDESSFDVLKPFRGAVDLELVGTGSYTESREASAKGDDLQVNHYYRQFRDDSAQLDVESNASNYNEFMQIEALTLPLKTKLLGPACKRPTATAIPPSKNNRLFGARRIAHDYSSGATGLSSVSSSLDVHSNLVLGQLVTALVAGPNRTLATDAAYESPTQQRDRRVHQLANKVLPSLHTAPNGETHNAQSPQWYKRLMAQQSPNDEPL